MFEELRVKAKREFIVCRKSGLDSNKDIDKEINLQSVMDELGKIKNNFVTLGMYALLGR